MKWLNCYKCKGDLTEKKFAHLWCDRCKEYCYWWVVIND